MLINFIVALIVIALIIVIAVEKYNGDPANELEILIVLFFIPLTSYVILCNVFDSTRLNDSNTEITTNATSPKKVNNTVPLIKEPGVDTLEPQIKPESKQIIHNYYINGNANNVTINNSIASK